jgi:hypothetical protein
MSGLTHLRSKLESMAPWLSTLEVPFRLQSPNGLACNFAVTAIWSMVGLD